MSDWNFTPLCASKSCCGTDYIYQIYLDMYSMKYVAAVLLVHVCILLDLIHSTDLIVIEYVVYMIVLGSSIL